jgi:hypothetical protein
MRQRKYVKGDQLAVDEAVGHILAGRYVFWFNRPVHPGWAASWQFRMLANACKGGVISEAVPNPEYVEKTK